MINIWEFAGRPWNLPRTSDCLVRPCAQDFLFPLCAKILVSLVRGSLVRAHRSHTFLGVLTYCLSVECNLPPGEVAHPLILTVKTRYFCIGRASRLDNKVTLSRFHCNLQHFWTLEWSYPSCGPDPSRDPKMDPKMDPKWTPNGPNGLQMLHILSITILQMSLMLHMLRIL